MPCPLYPILEHLKVPNEKTQVFLQNGIKKYQYLPIDILRVRLYKIHKQYNNVYIWKINIKYLKI